MRKTLIRRQFGVGAAVATVALVGCTDMGGGDGPVDGTNGTDGEPVVGGAETTAGIDGVGTTTEDSA